MGKIILIPVLPHIKKIILKMQKEREPVKAELTNMLGLQIYSLIKDRTRRSIALSDKFSEKLTVELCLNISRRDHRIGRLILINNFYREYFNYLMFTWITGQYEAGIPAYEAIKNFLNYYDIQEEEYSYETGYRTWLRYKNDEYGRLKKNKLAIVS